MIESLPNELVESVIENLYSDRASLLSCARVARAWVCSSQRGIFRQIILELFPTGRKHQMDRALKLSGQLIMLFDANPLLATYVQSLELRCILQSYEDGMNSAANIIRRLTNVKEISFFAGFWGVISPPLKNSLADLFCAPSLIRISFAGVSMPTFAELASILSHAKRLKVLHFGVLFYNHDEALLEMEAEQTSLAPCPIQLNELTLNVDSRFITWFQRDWCPFEVRNLQTLSLDSVDAFTENIGLVKLAGRNLRELQLMHLELSDLNNYLKYTPNLETLCLGLSDEQTHLNNVAIIQDVFRPLLNSDGNKFPLQHLTIILVDNLVGASTSNTLDPWVTIDALFQKPEFALLKTVKFDLIFTRTVPSSFENLFTSNFPFLEESGKLLVNTTFRN